MIACTARPMTRTAWAKAGPSKASAATATRMNGGRIVFPAVPLATAVVRSTSHRLMAKADYRRWQAPGFGSQVVRPETARAAASSEVQAMLPVLSLT